MPLNKEIIMSIYDYSFTDNSGNTVEMSQFKNKVLLLVNVASQCGFTKQYEGLQELHKKYADQGLVVIGFPCNQFGSQEPGTDQDIKEFCQTNYGVDFLMSTKIDVNGDNAHPIYKFLKSEAKVEQIDWNFTKFVIDHQIRYLGPNTTPEEMDPHLGQLLKSLNRR
jgi:glutathione peroxidase